MFLPLDPIPHITNEVNTSNHETVVIMTSQPHGHPTTIKGSDYIIIDQKGTNVVVERQLKQDGNNRYHQQTRQYNNASLNPVASPATEALEYILEETKPNIQNSNFEVHSPNMDDNSLLLDLNELLRRDPEFSVLEDTKPISPPQFISSGTNIEAMNAANISIINRPGVAIPGSKQTSYSIPTATIVSGQAGNTTGGGGLLQNRLNMGVGGSIGSSVASSNERTAFDHGSLGTISPSFFPSNPNHNPAPVVSNFASNAFGPTLAQLNSPTENEIPSGLLTSTQNGIKMEINDIDVIDDLDLFLSSQSANVSLAQPDIKPNIQEITRQQQARHPVSLQNYQIKQETELSPDRLEGGNRTTMLQNVNVTPLTNMNFWQASTDELIFGASSIRSPLDSSGGAANSGIASLSSSVPVEIFTNVNSPLSGIPTELSPPSGNTSSLQPNSPLSLRGMSPSIGTSVSPNGFIIGSSTIGNALLSPNTQTPSNAGPTRNSTLHKLLMQRKGDNPITGRPSPVRSPEARKTLEQMKNSLSTSNSLISQQLLSRSAPTGNNPLGQGNPQTETRVWTRREPRQHISSICSDVGTSSIADEVNDVLEGLSPNDDLHDIPSDDEDDLPGNYDQYKESSDGMYIATIFYIFRYHDIHIYIYIHIYMYIYSFDR